ncbi:hypothetical protein [Neobacillus vireti]|uniref:Lipoprotein n=1 Tax=Neobacillus vireti LMG 21834 TaxID=1131730 RepID=A0AB94IJ10_9BACI|nr:hypothetical protein [Neobacillus vireti]ETI67049.1 hypothetical protein BAVI_19524 [Neobacillus vireti LMG 21834]KLT18019.1 hypothetical protein AA980_10065 [Neobacillus vireti]
MKKIFFSCLLSVFLLVALSACSDQADAPASKSSDEKKSEETKSVKKEKDRSADELYAYGLSEDLPLITDDFLKLEQVSYDFIVKNHTLFPSKTDKDVQKVKQMTDDSINYKLLNKNATPYFEKVASFEGDVVTVEEKNLDNNEVVSVLHIIDDEENNYQILMYKSTGDILEEDRVRFWGLPLGGSSFENVSGGSTNVQVFFGATVEKVQ